MLKRNFFVWNTLNFRLAGIQRNEDIREKLGVEGINEVIFNYRRLQCEYLQKMADDRLAKVVT